jgi:Chromate transporter
MNATGQLWTLVWTFALMSFFAVGGANSAIPEMHRLAVDVHHWMNDKEFADMFAISQLSPGPNVLIVTLIGYSVAGIFGAVAATLAMCGPTAILALLCERAAAALQRIALARHHPGGAGSAFHRPDGCERADTCPDLRPELGGGFAHNCCSGPGLCHEAQSVLDIGGRGAPGFCWRCLTKIASKVLGTTPRPSRTGAKPCRGRESNE